MFHTHYDFDLAIGLIVVVFFICCLAVSFEPLKFNSLVCKYKKISLVINALILATVIWCLHFMGMLNEYFYIAQSVNNEFKVFSYLMAFMASILAIGLSNRPKLSIFDLILGAVLVGCSIFTMHYFEIRSLVLAPEQIQVNGLLTVFALSIAIIGSVIVLWLIRYSKKMINKLLYIRIFIVMLMVLIIMGIHYTNMQAISFDAVNYSLIASYSIGNKTILFVVFSILALILLAGLNLMLLEQRLKLRNKQLFKAHPDLADLILQDHLTKLPNRLFLSQYLEYLFSGQVQQQSKTAFLYIDLDRFKAVNVAFGHEIGDQLLVQFASRLKSKLNQNEQLFRIGNDEFLMVLEQSKLENAIQKAEQVLQLVQQNFTIADKIIHVSSSIGIAIYPDHGNNLQDLLSNADAALTISKSQGRNNYSVFSYTADQQHTKSQIKLLNDLYKAVEEQQFILFYQPKFTTQTQQVCGVEALIRWNHPHLGQLTPSLFIAEAEKTGLIIELGYWALEQACKQIKIWEQNHLNYFPVAVNLSAIQFEHKHLFSILENLFKKYSINPHHLAIEITESTAMKDIAASIRCLEQLRQMGIQLAIDDFGTGHSSFLYLKDLPVDELKIDRAFINNLTVASKDEMILESIIHLAIKLGLVVTAEGVETPLQAEILKRLGCQQMQGYLLGMPMDAQRLNEMKYNGSA